LSAQAVQEESAEKAFRPKILRRDAVAAQVAIRGLMGRNEVEEADGFAEADNLDGLADGRHAPAQGIIGAVRTAKNVDHKRRITTDQFRNIAQVGLRGAQQLRGTGQHPRRGHQTLGLGDGGKKLVFGWNHGSVGSTEFEGAAAGSNAHA